MTRTKQEIEAYLDQVDQSAYTKPISSNERRDYLSNIQFLSPNEPISVQSIYRVLKQIHYATKMLEIGTDSGQKTINLWSPNVVYQKDDIILYFKTENKQIDPSVGKRVFAFLLVSTKDNNSSTPNYDMVDGIPSFTNTNWYLLNPMSYLIQDVIGMKSLMAEIFNTVLSQHIKDEHGLISSVDIEKNLLKADYSNLITPMVLGKYAVTTLDEDTAYNGNDFRIKMDSNGILEYSVNYQFDDTANKQDFWINDRKYYHQKSPIWDESDQTIFAQKYIEDDLFSVVVNQYKDANGNFHSTKFGNLRYGTNIFHAKIEFPTPFANDEYCVFFDTYGESDFVFGLNKSDIQSKTEPTYGAIVSRPMLLNKSKDGFDIVLPIHTYFNSIQKYRIGVPWKNKFTLQAIGRYR